jgi:hypothetical protein
MTKITLENEFGTYSVECKRDIQFIEEYFLVLIIPALCAASFTEETVYDCIESIANGVAHE